MTNKDKIGFLILTVLDIFLFWSTYELDRHDVLFTVMVAGVFSLIGWTGAFANIMAREGRKERRERHAEEREPRRPCEHGNADEQACIYCMAGSLN